MVGIKKRNLPFNGGGSAYKFGIYKWENEPSRMSGRSSDNEYAWYTKYGGSLALAFKIFLGAGPQILAVLKHIHAVWLHLHKPALKLLTFQGPYA